MKMRLGMKEKVLSSALGAIIASVLVITIVSYSVSSKALINLDNEQRMHFVSYVNEELGTWLKQVEDDAGIIANASDVKNACAGGGLDSARAYLTSVFSVKGIYENVFIADPQGRIFASAVDHSTAEGIELSQLPPYSENASRSARGQVWVSGVNKSPGSGRPVVLVTVPVVDNGSVVGIVGTPVELNTFSEKYIDTIEVGKRGYAYMADAKGVFIAHPEKDMIFDSNLRDLPFGEEVFAKKEGMARHWSQGEKKAEYFSTNQETGWIVLITDFVADTYVARLRNMKSMAFFLGLVTVLAAGAVIWLIISRSVGVIKKVGLELGDIAEKGGDLTHRLGGEGDDEIGILVRNFNKFIKKLHEIISEVKASAEDLVSSSNEIQATSTQLAAGTEEQTAQASDIATSVQEMTASIVENSKNVNHASNLATNANEKTVEGKKAMGDAKSGAETVALVTEKAVGSVQSLSDRAGKIGEVIAVINDIADQTNLLALNAAIEAARAGEQGRGFAVVADEVRKLAERTTKATQEITDTIHAMQEDTTITSQSMLEAQQKVHESVEAAVNTDAIFSNIAGAVNTIMDMMNQIATATEQMSSGAEQISKNMESISAVSGESASGVEQMSVAAGQLNKRSEALLKIIGQFDL